MKGIFLVLSLAALVVSVSLTSCDSSGEEEETSSIQIKPFEPSQSSVLSVGDIDNPYFLSFTNADSSPLQYTLKFIADGQDVHTITGEATSGVNYIANDMSYATFFEGLAWGQDISVQFTLMKGSELVSSKEFLLLISNGGEIYNWLDLKNIKHDMSGQYRLMNDITIPDTSTYPTSTIMSPIKGLNGEHFSGEIRGNPAGDTKAIQNLVIKCSGCDAGLFERLGGPAYQVRDLAISYRNDDGLSGTGNVGGLAGSISNGSNGVLSNIQVSGNISGTGVVGGIIGVVRGNVGFGESSGFMSFSGTISATGEVGGLIGRAENSSTSNLLIFKGFVKDASLTGTNVGGIAASIEDYGVFQLKNSYVQLTDDYFLSGNEVSGGLVGSLDIRSASNDSRICNSYVAAKSIGTESTPLAGNIVAHIISPAPEIFDVVYDSQKNSLPAADIVLVGVRPMSTSDMYMRASYTSIGWDFVNVWDIKEGEYYPFLRKYAALRETTNGC